ncbi:MAG: hypothetical protein P1Q69_09045 [Candidatus Thorarchaeota archaeon]|nr:hypothetical protein [Candidatus Thorarchaeota archaeon]
MKTDIYQNPVIFLTNLLVVLLATIGYAIGGITSDSSGAIFAFILIFILNVVLVYNTVGMFDSISFSGNTSKIMIGLLIFLIPLLLVDLSTTILIPTILVGGLHLRSLAFLGIAICCLLAIFATKKLDDV